ncbi:MAG: hypothetical protein R6U96_16000 [Promethearchaeia archaeon]
MSKSKKQLEQEADQIEKQAQEEVKDKNYDLAILLLKDAKDIYLQIGYSGQVGILEKKIERFEKLQSLEKEKNQKSGDSKRELEKQADKLLEKAENARANQKIGKVIMNYKEALQLYDKLNYDYQCKKIRWKINKIKNKELAESHKPSNSTPDQDHSSLSIAERRKQRIQKQKEKEEKQLQEAYSKAKVKREQIRKKVSRAQQKEKEDQEYLKRLREREKEQERERKKIQEKLKKQEEKKQEEEKLVNEANAFLESAKMAVDNKQFSKAKQNYRDAIKIFKQLEWFNQVDVLYKEIKNLNKYKFKHQRKLKKREERRQNQKKEFEARINRLKKEKTERQRKRAKQLKELSPELKRRMDKISMLIEKAEKEIRGNKIQRALKRYRYCVELYESFPEEKIDLTYDLTQIKEKIEDLEQKK